MKQVKWNELTVGRDYYLQNTKSVLRFIRSDDAYVYFKAIINVDSYTPNNDDLMYFLIKKDYSFYELPLKLGTHIGTIKKGDYGFYFYPKDVYCGGFFYTKDIHKIKYDLQKECLGYTDNSGSFPYCKSKADVIKFINFLNDRYPEGKEVKSEGQPRTIKPEQAQKIIDIACKEWKSRLANLWAESIVLDVEIMVPEYFYQEMRKACTTEQHKLFDEIFGVDCPFKKGELILVKCSSQWNLRYFSHIENRRFACFVDQNKEGRVDFWPHARSSNGLILPD